MNRIFLVALREYLENVRTKAFLIAIFLTPLLMGLSFVIPAFLEGKRPEPRTIALVDVTGTIGGDVASRLASHRGDDRAPLYVVETVPVAGADAAAREQAYAASKRGLDARVLAGELFAYVVLRPSALDRKEAAPSEYRAGNLFDVKTIEQVRTDLSDAVNARVVARAAIPADAARILSTKAPLVPQNVREATKEAGIAATIMPFAFAFLLFLTIVTISQALVTSTIEEKSNRVVEVLLSSVSPFQLMAGKIVGTCAVGLTLMTIWTTGGLAGLAMNGMAVVTGGQLGLCLVYYLLGFFFFASLMVAIGSACNTLKEAQNLLAPVMALISISFMFVVAVLRDPSGSLARVLSFIPVFTPFVMMLRVGSTPAPPAIEVVGSIAVLALAAALAMRLAGRIFRVGVLMYGKPPSLRELFRWARAKD